MSTLSPAYDRPHTGGGLDGLDLALPGWRTDAWRTHVAAAGALRPGAAGDFTHLHLGLVHDPALRETLSSFERVLKPVRPFHVPHDMTSAIRPHAPAVTLPAVLGRPGPPTWVAGPADGSAASAEPDAVAAVGWVGSACGVPVVDVLAAAGIKERTFHEWKANGRQPRLNTQGRLWAVHQAVQDLVSDLGGEDALRRWMLADPARRGLFRTGDLQRVRATAVPDGPATTGASPAAVAALGYDSEPDGQPGGARTRPVRGTPTRRSTRASAGPRLR